MTLAPAKAPCGTCPYRCDVPSGVWHADEYAKLPPYDGDTSAQPLGLFHCHQQDGRICAGWAGTHDMHETLAVRLAASTGNLAPDVVEALLDYATEVPLFDSGQAAADHGLAEVDEPGEKARKKIDTLTRRLEGHTR
jgi:hypothetical protein